MVFLFKTHTHQVRRFKGKIPPPHRVFTSKSAIGTERFNRLSADDIFWSKNPMRWRDLSFETLHLMCGVSKGKITPLHGFFSTIDTLTAQIFFFSRALGGSDSRLIYRHYATLYFVFCVDSSESELGILDLIQVYDLKMFLEFVRATGKGYIACVRTKLSITIKSSNNAFEAAHFYVSDTRITYFAVW